MRKIFIFLLFLLFISTVLGPIVAANVDNNYSSVNNNSKFSLFSRDRKGPILDRIIDFLKKIPFINKTINFFKNLFNLIEENEFLVDAEDFDEPYGVYYQDMRVEPGSEKPTDTSISVSIKNFDLKFSDKENWVEFDMTFDGSTSGDVYACYYTYVNYYTDGTTAYSNVWVSPLKGSKITLAGYSIEAFFTGNGPQGENDWSRFKARQYISGVIDLDKKIFNTFDEYKDKTLKDVRLYVRGFSDKELTQWNQDSISMMYEMTGTVYNEPKPEEDAGIPGFETILLVLALIVVLVMFLKKKK